MSPVLGCLRISDHDGHFLLGSSQQAHPELRATAALLSQRRASRRAERITTLPEQPLHAAFGSAAGEPTPLPPCPRPSLPSPTSISQDLQLGEGGRSRSLGGGGTPALGACSPLLHGFGSGWVTTVCSCGGCQAAALPGLLGSKCCGGALVAWHGPPAFPGEWLVLRALPAARGWMGSAMSLPRGCSCAGIRALTLGAIKGC